MTEPYGFYSYADAKRIKDKVLAEGSTGGFKHEGVESFGPYYAVLTSGMTAAANPLTGQTTFTFKPLVYTAVTSKNMQQSASANKTGINRTQATGDVGTLIVVMRVANEWCPIWVDCEAYI